jgi:hypothetical protein
MIVQEIKSVKLPRYLESQGTYKTRELPYGLKKVEAAIINI